MKKALITGITGQDGSYLADLLLEKGYEVHGIIRRASTFNTARIDHLYADPHINGVRLFLHYGDLSDSVNLVKLIYDLKPDEIYHLAAQSHVRVSFDIPEYTSDVTGVGTIRILEAIRETGIRSRFYQASSSEMFGKVQEVPQTETTPFWPRSPYGVAKVFAYWATVNYRESYGLCASNGILFNHESPRRGETFVTRKITRAVAAIKHGLQKELFLGNLDAKRDWGYAPEYVEGMWRILQHDEGDDFVLATNETHTVREFARGRVWPRRSRLEEIREARRTLRASGRGGSPDRRRDESEEDSRLGTESPFPRAGRDHGRCRHGAVGEADSAGATWAIALDRIVVAPGRNESGLGRNCVWKRNDLPLALCPGRAIRAADFRS